MTHVQLEKSVLYEDEHLLVLNKPGGVACQKGTDTSWNVVDAIRNASERWSAESFHLVHRLDKETSGVLMLAKSSEAASRVSQLIRDKMIRKTYLAVTSGRSAQSRVDPDGGHMESQIFAASRHDRKVDKNKTLLAESEYVTIAQRAIGDQTVSLLQLKPVSGRKRQLRIHCALELCAPIIGETRLRYFVRDQMKLPSQARPQHASLPKKVSQQRVHWPSALASSNSTFASVIGANPALMLLSHSLQFTHPFSNKSVYVEARAPSDMQALMNWIESDE
jgi:23S rRNA-/tRNA-specific pseudouridylate synthase